MVKDDYDPKGLIREGYAIEGITLGECRSIFLDWALSVPPDADHGSLIAGLLDRYGQAGHPMTVTLQAGLGTAAQPKRRGGHRGRVGS